MLGKWIYARVLLGGLSIILCIHIFMITDYLKVVLAKNIMLLSESTHGMTIFNQVHAVNEELYACSMTPNNDWYNDPRRRGHFAKRTKTVFFNRIPKTGSGVARFVMEQLQHHNDFFYYNDDGKPDHPRRNTSIDESNLEPRILTPLASSDKALQLFIGHMHFINFKSHKLEMPLYINLVRDPISRLVSWYYYTRFKAPNTRPKMSDVDRYRTLDECVMTDNPECTVPSFISATIPYFCGQESFCKTGSLDSLEQAKHNVLRYFSVVGYMERLDDFFIAIEYMLPDFFGNATIVYADMKDYSKFLRTQNTKINPSHETVKLLKSRLAYEYDFYYFVKSRFDCLMKRIQDASTSNIY